VGNFARLHQRGGDLPDSLFFSTGLFAGMNVLYG